MSSLVEIVVCLLIFTLMLFGLDAAQVITLRQAKSAYYASVAIQQLNVLSEMLRTETGETIDEKMMQWNQQNQKALPQGRGTVEVGDPSVASIFWGNHNANCTNNKLGLSGCLRRYLA